MCVRSSSDCDASIQVPSEAPSQRWLQSFIAKNGFHVVYCNLDGLKICSEILNMALVGLSLFFFSLFSLCGSSQAAEPSLVNVVNVKCRSRVVQPSELIICDVVRKDGASHSQSLTFLQSVRMQETSEEVLKKRPTTTKSYVGSHVASPHNKMHTHKQNVFV